MCFRFFLFLVKDLLRVIFVSCQRCQSTFSRASRDISRIVGKLLAQKVWVKQDFHFLEVLVRTSLKIFWNHFQSRTLKNYWHCQSDNVRFVCNQVPNCIQARQIPDICVLFATLQTVLSKSCLIITSVKHRFSSRTNPRIFSWFY